MTFDVEPESGLDRRSLIAGAAVAGVAGLAALTSAGRAYGLGAKRPVRIMPAQTRWSPPPPQVPVTEGVAELSSGAKLYYWDTGGSGEPVVLLHPRTGSAKVWGYQQPVLAKAGYRVIGYSRRGHAGSEAPAVGAPTGSAVKDLDALMDYLKVQEFHIVGTAAGGFVVPDYALSHGDRLISAVIASSQGGVTEPAYRAVVQSVVPQNFATFPASFRELGPSYRAANPAGVTEWDRLEHQAFSAGRVVIQAPDNRLNYDDLERIKTRTLVFTGGADLYAPPPLNLLLSAHLQSVELGVLEQAGHSGYWEQYVGWNALVLDFLRRNPRR